MSEATKEAIWELRAKGLSEHKISRRLGLGRNTVSIYLRSLGGIRPRPRRRAERCLALTEREEISRGIASGHSARAIARALGRAHTTIAREINRCGGRLGVVRRPVEAAMQSSMNPELLASTSESRIAL